MKATSKGVRERERKQPFYLLRAPVPFDAQAPFVQKLSLFEEPFEGGEEEQDDAHQKCIKKIFANREGLCQPRPNRNMSLVYL